MADGNYSAFLSGRKGIGAEATCLLLKYLAMPKREVIAMRSYIEREEQRCKATLDRFLASRLDQQKHAPPVSKRL